jgi:chaperone modulatory protein CbpM
MKNEDDIIVLVEGVSTRQLRMWASEAWVCPTMDVPAKYSDTDIARVRLLDLLTNQLEVGDEAVPIILSLIDQIHDLRHQMQVVAAAIDAHPGDLSAQLLEIVRKQA